MKRKQSETEMRREFIELFESLEPEDKDFMEKILRGMAAGTISIADAWRMHEDFIRNRDARALVTA
jgi:hypothetical protein